MPTPRRRQTNAPGSEPGAPVVTPGNTLADHKGLRERLPSMIPHHVPRSQVDRHRQLKSSLVSIGLRALRDGDYERVQLITDLLRAKGFHYA